MSEKIKEEIHKILCKIAHRRTYNPATDTTIAELEQYYIPKEEYKKKIELLSKSLLVIQNEHLREVETRIAFIDAHEKLREENEKLKGKAILSDAGEVLFISVADHKELMKMQRENCNFAFLDNQLHGEKSDAILCAPEPTIEDLNRE